MLDTDATMEQILAIPVTEPHRLYPGNIDAARLTHRRLAAIWHPDKGKTRSSEVLAHINVLFDAAVELITESRWTHGPSKFIFETKDGKKYQISYKKMHHFELGKVYIGENYVTYVVNPEYADLATNALKIMDFHYANKDMEKEHTRWLPAIHQVNICQDGSYVITLEKPPGYYMLQDVVDALGGQIDPRHVAWIVSCMCNINCYLKWANITHNNISAQTIFINPEKHSAILMGGWWYAGKVGHNPLAVPARTHKVGSDFRTKAIDGSLIRLTGLEICGPEFMNAPPVMQRWLRGLGNADSYTEYKNWSGVVDAAFGPRKFVKLEIPKEIYEV